MRSTPGISSRHACESGWRASGDLRRLLIAGLLAGLALAERRQPDAAHLYRLNAADGSPKAHHRLENLYQGQTSRGVQISGKQFRGACLDFGNLTVWNSRPVVLGDRILYPLPHQPEPPSHPFWLLESDRLSSVRWMTREQARQLRWREAKRLVCLRSGTRFNGILQPDGSLAFSDDWHLSPDGSLKRGSCLVPGHFRQLSLGGRFPVVTYQPELAAAGPHLLLRKQAQLSCLETPSGRTVWTQPCTQALYAAWSFPHQELYVLLEQDLVRLDPNDGKLLWSRRLAGCDATLFRTPEALWVVTEEPAG